MILRKQIEPQFDIAEKHYPEVLKLILDYTAFCDENGDEEFFEYKKLEEKLHVLTEKDIVKFNLIEWWEEDGVENLAFDISLPEPEKVDNLTREELYEIVQRIKTFDEINYDNVDFISTFYINVISANGYFIKFLEKNFKQYNYKLFQRNKDKKGNYFEYSIEEIVQILWNNGNI
ncbi:hypothetical protein NYQ10_13660 [Flavobacterium johnsoniae]|uniref:hypothetical protein n=1 Tax=Flavobacterium johnsoniae TaxID=986 RepID=UPI0025B18F7A|nr:hypothetical protein [Flavobacterium johnsoniae]WJS93136.1 hypothetical protein NYQ10_13660 [Flavobacterium johnsoniae]